MRVWIPSLAVMAAAPALAGDWAHLSHDRDATNRADGVAAFVDAPSISWALRLGPAPLPSALLAEGADGPHAIIEAGGSVVALDPTLGGIGWATPAQRLDAIAGAWDLDGDGAIELVGTSNAVGGGAVIVGLDGGVRGSVGGLPLRSGVQGSEVAAYDLDSDGSLELVLPAGFFGLGSLFIAEPAIGTPAPVFELTFPGYSNFTPPRVGRLMPGGNVGIVLNQGPEYSVFEVCAASASGAICSASSALCVCPRGKLFSVFPTYSFGTSYVIDADGDGVDEVIEIASSASYTKAMASLDFAAGFATGAGVTSAAKRWYRQYGGATGTRLVPAESGPADLDGDGDPDLIVSFFDNDGADIDGTGQPSDDGIDAADAIAFGVFDLGTGELLAFQIQAFAYGAVDFDGDGAVEIVASPTDGWSFDAGLIGWEFECGGGCSLQQAWELPGATLDRELARHTALSFPRARVPTVDHDGDGVPELVVYEGSILATVTLDESGEPTLRDLLPLSPDERVVEASQPLDIVLLGGDEAASMLDGSLTRIGLTLTIPPRGWAPPFAARTDGSARAALVFDSLLYTTADRPASAVDADAALLPRTAMAADLDGDGRAEWISFRNPADGGTADFAVEAGAWNPGTDSFETRWTMTSASHPALDGFVITGPLHFADGDFDGVGARDIVFAAGRGAQARIIVLSGDDGAVISMLDVGIPPATNAPLLVDDVASPDGTAVPDGLDDIIVDGANYVKLAVPGHVGPVYSIAHTFIHGVTANVDLDGDSVRDVLATLSATTANKAEALVDLGAPDVAWGPQPMPLPTGTRQVVSAMELDGDPGLDAVYIDGEGGISAYAGRTGMLLPGFPVYIADGGLAGSADPFGPIPQAVMVIDVDDDGHEEIVVGDSAGHVRAIDVDPAEVAAPTLLWDVYVASPVMSVAAADQDGDGFDELLVSTATSWLFALDTGGAKLSIVEPAAGTCIETVPFIVRGTSSGLDLVEVSAAGAVQAIATPDGAGDWSAEVRFDGIGAFSVDARGVAGGSTAAFAQVVLQAPGDADGDGVTNCGPDCNSADETVYAGAEETCEDGIDQDCDGADAICEDEPAPPTGGGCGDCAATGTLAWLPFALSMSWRRRQR